MHVLRDMGDALKVDYNAIIQTCAMLAIAAGVWRNIDRSVTVNVPDVKIPEIKVPAAPPAQVKVVMPADIEKATTEAHRLDIGQRQPDGSYQWIGGVDVLNPYDRATWPSRIETELATPGRAIRLPNGTIDEGMQ